MRRRPLAPAFAVAVAVSMVTGTVAAQQLSPPKRLTDVQDAYPMLSPDGKSIAFQSNRSGDWEIYVMKSDGTGLVQLTRHAGTDETPIWSPDGKRILFSSEREGDNDVYVMNADGSSVVRLTRQPGDDSHAHWSPDGTRIVFNSARATPDPSADWGKQFHEIFTMATDGSDVKQLTSAKTVSTYPSYSPDGRRIVFRSVTTDPSFRWDLSASPRNSEVFVMKSDGTEMTNLTKHAAFDGWPVWSPDGKTIVFSSNREGPANIGQLFAIDPDGGNLHRLTNGPGSFVQPSWSMDGRRLYAHQHWETEAFGNLVVFEVSAARTPAR